MIKFCHYVKINSFYNKYNICAFNKDIEGNPFIIRFKSKIAIKNIIKFLHIFIKRLKFHHF